MSSVRTMLVAAAMLTLSGEVGAQMFKCTDVGGKVTYSSTRCADMGLKDAGQVQDRIQVTPAPAPTSQPSSGAKSQGDDRPVRPAAAAEPPKEPERRCFTTNVKGKSVTRCNDKPDED